MSGNIFSDLMANLVPLLLAIIIVTIIVLYILNSIKKGVAWPFVKVKEKWNSYRNYNKINKIQRLEIKILDYETKFKKNKDIIAGMKGQLNDLSGIFEEITKTEAEYSKNINKLGKNRELLSDIQNNNKILLKIIKPFRIRIITGKIKMLGNKINANEKNINERKETIKDKITEMLDSINNLSDG
jgi:chromosome segregation ATPase